jgi:predicted RNA binding protein YcfA (HicA-like mRNA interferase family)
MKHRELLRIIARAGALFVRHGARHDIYQNPRTGKKEQVPRHAEVKELTARAIIKSLTQ